MNIHKIRVSKTTQNKIRKNYPWVFHYQILNDLPNVAPGDLGVIYDHRNKFLAIGLIDPFSDLRLRILQTKTPCDIGREFFRERFAKALTLRKPLESQNTTGYRIIHGENDGFPGLVLDRYEDTLVLKLYTSAWASYLPQLLEIFLNQLPVKRCVLRVSRNALSQLENTTSCKNGQVLHGPPITGPIRFRENGLWFEADVLHGQKTGFFLDQRENRKQIRDMAKNRTVLNVFSYTGGFTAYAFAGKCKSVWEVDSSAPALTVSRKHLAINFPDMLPDPPVFQQFLGDAFEVLAELHRKKQNFDLVILDPPSFANKKKQKRKALEAYRRLARIGITLVRSGGILYSASCSSQVSAEEFFDVVIRETTRHTNSFKEILRTEHPLDHPAVFKEGKYLKGIYLEIH